MSYRVSALTYFLMKMRPTESTTRPIVNAMTSTIATDRPACHITSCHLFATHSRTNFTHYFAVVIIDRIKGLVRPPVPTYM